MDHSKAHEKLYRVAGSRLQDSMIPHSYSPAQKAWLHLVDHDAQLNLNTLNKETDHVRELYSVSTEEMLEELLSNPMILTWLQRIHVR